jgi:hypothetical protein
VEFYRFAWGINAVMACDFQILFISGQILYLPPANSRGGKSGCIAFPLIICTVYA